MFDSRYKQEPSYEATSASMAPAFQTAICECPDVYASTMAVDITGRFAMVSGRRCMGLIDLDGNGPNEGLNSDLSTNLNTSSTAMVDRLRQGPVCRRFIRNSKYEPTSSQFNRHLADLYALSTYQVIEIFSIDDINPLKPKLSLRGHSRAIADIEWSHFDPHLLGSSAADCLTNLWDIRDSRRPSACLTSVSGATLVRFCRTSSNLIATSHEIDVRIWDIRQPNLPLNYIAAHLQKIHGMDWNPSKSNCDQEQLITCSQDNTIKLWDLTTNKIRPNANLQTRTPAWRVRFTPVSPYAILTSTLPQLRSRSECMTLKLWSMKTSSYEQKKLDLILGLTGHTDVIVDFDWRHQGQSSGSCEIVSWSKDQTLRVWNIDNQFIELNVDNSDYELECEARVGADLAHEVLERTSTAESRGPKSPSEDHKQLQKTSSLVGEPSSSRHSTELTHTISSKRPQLEEVADSSSPAEGNQTVEEEQQVEDNDDQDEEEESNMTTNELRQEFNLINKNIPNVEFEELNSLRRICLVTARSKNVICRLRIALPPNYPHSECPTFTIIDSSHYRAESLSRDAKEKLTALLNETAKVELTRRKNCIEPCLRRFIAALQKLTNHTSYRRKDSTWSAGTGSAAAASGTEHKEDPITLSAQRDHSVPFPATCGARFCGNLLVCFGRPLLPSINNDRAIGAGASSGGESTSFSIETPRSMAQMSAQLDNMRRQGCFNLSSISISYFYYGAMRRAELQSRTSRNPLISTRTPGGSSSSSSKYFSSRARLGALGVRPLLAKNFKCGPVIVYDVSYVLSGISKELAKDYVFDKDVLKMCRRNSEIAAAHNRRDLVQIWSLAELSSEGVLRSFIPNSTLDGQDSDDCPPLPLLNSYDSDFGDRPWTMHPFGSKLIQSLIDHYVYNRHDVQTAAMLVWTFSSPKPCRFGSHGQIMSSSSASTSRSHKGKTCGGNEALVVADGNRLASNLQQEISGPNLLTGNVAADRPSVSDAISDEWNFVNDPEAHLYSNSWSNSTNINEEVGQWGESRSGTGCKVSAAAIAHCDASESHIEAYHKYGQVAGGGSQEQHYFPRLNILNPDRSLQNDLILHIYAELLYRLNLLNQRAMVLKNIGSNSAYSEIFGDKQILAKDVAQERLPNLAIQCSNLACGNQRCHSVQCADCKKYSFYCSVCRLPVKGSCSICLKCLHGGHVNHFSVWFESHDFCPTGCGCNCLTVPQ